MCYSKLITGVTAYVSSRLHQLVSITGDCFNKVHICRLMYLVCLFSDMHLITLQVVLTIGQGLVYVCESV